MIWLEEPFKSLWSAKDPFHEVSLLGAAAERKHIFRDKEGRRTLRFEQGGKSYFLKHHRGVGWKEILKNLFQLRLPVLGARNEFEAAQQLQALGIDTLTPLAFAERGCNPAARESFLITADLVDTSSLEDYCRPWPKQKPDFRVKKALVEKVAYTAKTMHESGINHRDFYICHFLLEKNADEKILAKKDFHCHLIDLHRCQIRTAVPLRWRIKDLGGLYYSAMDIGLTRRDCYRFIRRYTSRPLRVALADTLWNSVRLSAEALYRKDFNREPPSIF